MTTLIVVLGFLPGFAWLYFYLREDTHPEPKSLIALTFLAGAVSAFIALGIEYILSFFLRGAGIERMAISSLLAFALIEETVKFGAAYFSVRNRAALDEPVDAMIYMVTAALGFATVENLGAVSLGTGGAGAAIISNIFATTSLRFVGATLLHSLTSGLVGYYWAWDIREFKIRKYIYVGIVAATVLHATFNHLILAYGNLAYLVMFLTVIGFFVLNDFEKMKNKAV
ncbi:MAG: PrsW family glutamic-type intramembrane protease [Patescibacteria group bacterium]